MAEFCHPKTADEFFRAEAEWKRTRDPRLVWRVIRTCCDEDLPLPEWAQTYLSDAAPGIINIKWDVGRALKRVLGFSQKGRLHDSTLDLKNERFAVDFACRVSKGEKARDACFNAAEKESIGAKDSELRQRLKDFFKLNAWPTAKQQRRWKLIIILWLLKNPAYAERYPELLRAVLGEKSENLAR